MYSFPFIFANFSLVCSSINHLLPRVCECQSSELTGERSGSISDNWWEIQDNGMSEGYALEKRQLEEGWLQTEWMKGI